MKKRIDVIDIAKAIGIILLIIGHKTDLMSFKNFVSLFLMPMFFIYSGFVMNENKNIKSENKLLASYLVYSLFFAIYYGLFIEKCFKGFVLACWQTVTLYGISVLWFVSSLWAGKILVKNIYRIKTINIRKILITIIYSISYTISIFLIKINNTTAFLTLFKYLSYSVIRVGNILIFIYLGYSKKKYIKKFIEFIENRTLFCILCAIALFPILLVFSRNIIYDYHQLINGPFLINIIGAILGTLFILLISSVINKLSIKEIFCWIGKNTLFIMTLDFYSIYPKIKYILHTNNKFILAIFYSLIAFTTTKYISPFFEMLIKKVEKILNKYIVF